MSLNLITNSDISRIDEFDIKPAGFSLYLGDTVYPMESAARINADAMYVTDAGSTFIHSTCAGKTSKLSRYDNPIGAPSNSLYVNVHGYTNLESTSPQDRMAASISQLSGLHCGSFKPKDGAFSQLPIHYTEHVITKWLQLPTLNTVNSYFVDLSFDYQLMARGRKERSVTTIALCKIDTFLFDEVDTIRMAVDDVVFPPTTEVFEVESLVYDHNLLTPQAPPEGLIYVPSVNPDSVGTLGTTLKSFTGSCEVKPNTTPGVTKPSCVRITFGTLGLSDVVPNTLTSGGIEDAGRWFISNLKLTYREVV